MTVRRWGARRVVATAAAVLVVSGCTTTTLEPSSSTSANGAPSSGAAVATATTTGAGSASTAAPSTTSGSPAGSTGEPTTVEPVTSSAGTAPDTASSDGSGPTAPTTTGFTPAVDAEAVEGECPYLSKDQVQSDTGQRMGTTRIRPAEPQPVCEFVRNDGDFLATVRVLELATDTAAVDAVDFYVPRAGSNPETRPTGWTGGSLATDGGSIYGVSKGTAAVIAETNQKQSVYARLLVVHAIENLGL
ncbi:DUF2020 domain-containing protein [Nakamurella deserti]|uniref:DUF2020 domain-containing protein n=1 Tax=Nakamurella deserti TaxID=2164074 RepID=UPI000DBE155F|nr:DUF2020 domain-containing protein [Nakamurella deserti]